MDSTVGVDVAFIILPTGSLGQDALAIAELVAADGRTLLVPLHASAAPAQGSCLILREEVPGELPVGMQIQGHIFLAVIPSVLVNGRLCRCLGGGRRCGSEV